MLIVISPAKTLDFESPSPMAKSSKPSMLKDSAELVDIMRTYSPNDLVNLMGISHKLGELNSQRYLDWHVPFNKSNAKQAIYAFKGDVYTGLDAERFDEEEMAFAQNHLRVLSGLYGLLKPLDLIQPYRLEMGTKLKNERGENLYQFWGTAISKAINKQLKSLNTETLINLASNEYFKSIDKNTLNANVITPVFKDYKKDKYKIISFFAKKARGLMSAYAIQHRIEEPEQIKQFNVAGYKYDKKTSTENEWVFLRKEAE